MLLNDLELSQVDGLITPFVPHQVREENGLKVISYGLSSAGYDIRLAPAGCYIVQGEINVKHVDNAVKSLPLITDEYGTYYLIPPYTTALNVSLERFQIPPDLCGRAEGKSTYARCGLFVNITPIEPGWGGFLTLELFNSSHNSVRVYTGEGICQIQFFKINPPAERYDTRHGKYMNQDQTPTMAIL